MFLLAFIDIPGLNDGPPPYVKPTGSTQTRYLDVLENNTQVIYPLIAVVVVALIAYGIIAAWRTDDLDGVEKAELKREIIRLLRRDVYGLTADHIAKILKVPGGRLLTLLEEMSEANLVESRTDSSRVTTWRMKGLTG